MKAVPIRKIKKGHIVKSSVTDAYAIVGKNELTWISWECGLAGDSLTLEQSNDLYYDLGPLNLCLEQVCEFKLVIKE